MKTGRSIPVCCSLLLSVIVLMPTWKADAGQDKYTCSESKGTCSASTTCGSADAPCSVNIERTANAASVTAGIPGAKSDAPFCVRAGTTVTWKSRSKNVGFVLDFGPSNPFAMGTIIGGADRPISVVAKKPGCYKFSVGACVSGTVDQMCGQTAAEMTVIGGK